MQMASTDCPIHLNSDGSKLIINAKNSDRGIQRKQVSFGPFGVHDIAPCIWGKPQNKALNHEYGIRTKTDAKDYR